MDGYKLCVGHCGPPKPLSEFSPNLSHKDGRQSKCKSCVAFDHRKRYEIAKRQRPKRYCPGCGKMQSADSFTTKRSKICKKCIQTLKWGNTE
jgi:hypothetical protein